MMMGLVNEAFLCLEEGVASVNDIELGCRMGISFPGDGPLHWAQRRGLGNVLETLTKLHFEPSKLLRQLVAEARPVVEISDLDI